MALYRKYRPATFAEVVGQEHVTDPLSTALDTGRISHAYLFSGPRGCGKTSSARILARSLNCVQGPTSTPCGVCPSCVALGPGGPGNLDVIELDAASHGGVDDTRELRDRAFYAPAESRYRVFIVDEAHMVTTAGFNALLKIVEEPPAHLIFIFATTEPDKVLPTIRSRTHHYPFRLLPPATMRGLLGRICEQEQVPVEDAVYPLVIRAGGGSPRDSLSVLDQLLAGAGTEGVTYSRAVSLLGVTDVALIDDAIDALANDDGAALFGTVDRVMEAGHDPRRFAVDLLERLRDLILMRAVPDAIDRGLVSGPGDVLDRMQDQAARIGPATLTRYAELLHAGLGEMRGATAPRLLLEVICARMLLPSVSDEESATLQRLERLERGGVGSAPVPTGSATSAPAAAPAESAPPRSAPADPSRRRGAEALAAARRESRGGRDTLAVPPQAPTDIPVAQQESHGQGAARSDPSASGTDGRGNTSESDGAAERQSTTAGDVAGQQSTTAQVRSVPGGDPAATSGSVAQQSTAPAAANSVRETEAAPATGVEGRPGSATAATSGSVAASPDSRGGGAPAQEQPQGPPDTQPSGAASAANQPRDPSVPQPSSATQQQDVSAAQQGEGAAAAQQSHNASVAQQDAAASGAQPDRSVPAAPSRDDVLAAEVASVPAAQQVPAVAAAQQSEAGSVEQPRTVAAAPSPEGVPSAGAPASGPAAVQQSEVVPAVQETAESTEEPPAAAAEPDLGAGQPGEELLRAVEASWPEIRTKVREFGPTLQALLSGASVARVDAGTIVFAHQSAPLAQRLSNPKNLEAVRSAVHAVLGREHDVRWETGTAAPRAAVQRTAATGRHTRSTSQSGRESGAAGGRADGDAPPKFSRPSQARGATQEKPAGGARGSAGAGGRGFGGDDDIPPPDFPDLPDDPGPADFAPANATGNPGTAAPANVVAVGPDGLPLPSTPEEEQEMLAAAADPVAPEDRRDPDEVALELLKSELGATRLDG